MDEELEREIFDRYTDYLVAPAFVGGKGLFHGEAVKVLVAEFGVSEADVDQALDNVTMRKLGW